MSSVFGPRRRRSQWTALSEPAPGCYYRVKCNLCGFEEVKASARNVALCQTGHMGSRHFGHPWDFTVTPLQREDGKR